MARDKWKCPHDGCEGESSRRWNCKKHIRNLHQRECDPVKEKSPICQSQPEDTQFIRNASRNWDRSRSRSPYSYRHMWEYNALNTYHQNDYNHITEHNSQKRGGITSKGDRIDEFYQIFKKLKERNDKILEMRNYFENYGSDFRFPFFSPPNIFNNSLNVLLSDFSSNYSAELLRRPSFHPSSSTIPNKVIGYEIYICRFCLESESLPVMCDPNAGNELFKIEHSCSPDKVNTVRSYPGFVKEERYLLLQYPFFLGPNNKNS
jgi:hypothetical protein